MATGICGVRPLLGMCAALVLGCSAWGGENARCPKPITFALYEHGVFYDVASDKGVDKDLAELLMRRSGCRFELSLRSRARIWHDLQNGDLMMSGSGIPTEERRQFAWFVTYMSSKNFVMVRTDDNLSSAKQFENDPRLRWGAVRSYKHGPQTDAFLDRLRAQQRVAEEPDLLSVYRNFLRGRTDAIFVQPLVFTKYLAEIPPSESVRIVDWFSSEEPIRAGLILSRKHFSSEDLKYWRRLIAEMYADGTLRRLFSAYLPPDQVDYVLNFRPD